MKRIDAIKNIIDYVNDEGIIVSSCGGISREVFFLKDRPLNFYVMGSMSASLGIGIGVALNTKRKVIVIVGDGEVLMSLGTLVLLNNLQQRYELENLKLFILDNNCYQSTGTQPTVSHSIDFRLLCDCKVIFCKDSETDVPRITIPHNEIRERFMNAVK